MAIRCRRYFLRSSRGRLLNRSGAFLRSQAGRVELRLTRALAGGKRPIRVLEGLLNIAQDAVLGWRAPWKSPAGTTERVIETWFCIRGEDRDFSIAAIFEMEVPGIAPE